MLEPAELDAELARIERVAGEGDPAGALSALESCATFVHDVARVHDLRARLLLALHRPSDALRSAQRAAALEPENGAFLATIAICHELRGERASALEAFRRAVALQPLAPSLWIALGTALAHRADFASAAAAMRRALGIDPENHEAMRNLVALRSMAAEPSEIDAEPLARACADHASRLAAASLASGDFEAAARHALEAVRYCPGNAGIQHLYALALADSGELERALAHLGFAADIDPNLQEAVAHGARVAATLGLAEDAAGFTRRFVRQDDPVARLRRLTLPAINESVGQILETRARYESTLDELLLDPPQLESPEAQFDWTYFFLTYHGAPDRRLNVKLAQLMLSACPSLAYKSKAALEPRPHRRRLRVGFASRFLRAHSIGKTTRGLLAGLDRKRFEIYGLCLPPPGPTDSMSRWMADRCDHWIAVPEPLTAAREAIAAMDLDVLCYPDIGMESFGYFLSFARLARVQCVSFGHPDTTGVPTIDYFVSTRAFELQGANEHYSEQLWLLPGATTPALYYRPELSATADPRAALGLPSRDHLYVCPQSPFKLHPDLDDVFAGILRGDPRGRVLLAQGTCRRWTQALVARFHRTIPDVAARISFLPRLPERRFYDLLKAADVILDTPHFNGMNTSLEAFATGTPVVTLPTPLQRGRHTQAMYARMGIGNCVADSPADYVKRAVHLATEPEARHRAAGDIRDRSSLLFEESSVVDDWSAFFEVAVQTFSEH